MRSLREIDRGLVILVAAVATLGFITVDARQHFATMSAATASGTAGNPTASAPAAPAGDAARTTDLKPVRTGARGQIDLVYADGQTLRPSAQGTLALARPASLSIEGWAVATSPPGPLGGVLISLDGGPPLGAEYGRERGDVATALSCADCTRSGFAAAVDKARLGPGTHRLVLRYVLSGGTYVASAPLIVRVGGR